MNILQKFRTAYQIVKSAGSISLRDPAAVKDLLANWLGEAGSTTTNTGYISSCANIYGLAFTRANWRVYDIDEDNREETDHPAAIILRKPNWEQTAWSLKYRIAQHLIFEKQGAVLLKLRNKSNKMVSGLWQLHPDRITTYPQDKESIEYYEYNTGSGMMRIEKDDIVHFRISNKDNFILNNPVIEKIRDLLETEKLQMKYRKQLYKKAGFLGATFTTDKELNTSVFESRAKALEQKYGGDENLFRVAFFDSGIKPIATAYSPKDMQIRDDRDLNREEICAAFGVNKLMFGQSENIQRGNADTVNFVFYDTIIDPLLNYIDEELNLQLLYKDFSNTDGSQSFYIKHDTLAKRNIEDDLKYYENGLTNIWLKPSEVREAEGYEEDLELDELWKNNVTKNKEPQALPAN